MTLGNRITALRSRNHMSQGDLAERLGVSRQSVSKWETDTSVPDLDKLIALSDLFQVSLDQLIRGPLQDPNMAPSKKVHTESTNTRSTENDVTLQNKIGALCIITSILLALITLFVFRESVVIVSLLLLICGIICLVVQRHTLVWITVTVGIPISFIATYPNGFQYMSLLLLLIILICVRFYRSSK